MGQQRNRRPELGMVTAEYAACTVGGCGLACVLIALWPGFDDFLRTLIERGFSPIMPGLF